MKVEFNGINLLTKKLIKKVIYVALEELKQLKHISLSISFVGEGQIKDINSNHRGIDKGTDVLSFPSLDIGAGIQIVAADYPIDLDENENVFIGDIIVCPSIAIQQAEEFGHSKRREVAFLVLHGLLHLFGYNHEDEKGMREMEAISERVLSKCKITR